MFWALLLIYSYLKRSSKMKCDSRERIMRGQKESTYLSKGYFDCLGYLDIDGRDVHIFLALSNLDNLRGNMYSREISLIRLFLLPTPSWVCRVRLLSLSNNSLRHYLGVTQEAKLSRLVPCVTQTNKTFPVKQ